MNVVALARELSATGYPGLTLGDAAKATAEAILARDTISPKAETMLARILDLGWQTSKATQIKRRLGRQTITGQVLAYAGGTATIRVGEETFRGGVDKPLVRGYPVSVLCMVVAYDGTGTYLFEVGEVQ